MTDLLPSSLTESQRAAIDHVGGPLLIVAGPGAGKTDVMVRRAAYLVRERGVSPENLLVTTFTNKAADELYDRLFPFLGQAAHDIHISTIHSFCQTLLDRYPAAHTWGPGFEVLDAQGQFLFVYARLSDLRLSSFPKGRLGDFISDVVATFNLCTEERVDPAALVAEVKANGPRLLGLKKAKPEAIEEYLAVAEAYGRYRELLDEENVFDFATLQRAAYEMLQAHEDVRDEVRDRYRHVLVDEYQDTNRLQVLILKEIAAPRFELCAVGDDDQSIYRFRGASVKSFLRFEEDFPGAKRIDLDVNFRATPPLVEAASALIAGNAPHRTEKALTAFRAEPTIPAVLVHEETCADEAEVVVRALAGWRKDGLVRSYDDVAILFRSVKYYAEPYLEALDRHGVPYTVVADGGFFEREDVLHVKDLFTFCGWKHRWDAKFLEGKLLELDKKTLDAIRKWEEDPVAWADDATLDRLGIRRREDRALLKDLAELRHRTLEDDLDRQLLVLFYEILRASRYFERCCLEGPCGKADPEAESALLNLAQFSGLVAEFQRRVRSVGTYRLGQYLRTIPQRALGALRPAPPDEAVRVMTVHQAKGLEFPVVILGSAMQGRFPGRFRPARYPVPEELRLSGEKDDAAEHERDQRRLFYVAMTRAESLLAIGASDKVNSRGGGPSSFIDEIGPDRQITVRDLESRRLSGKAPKPRAPVRQRISYSALHSYLLCPLQYKLLHVCGFAVPQMHWYHFGAAMHRALERLHRQAAAGEPVDATVAEEIWKTLWRAPASWSRKQAAAKEKAGRQYLRRYVQAHKDRFARVRYVEEPVELALGDEFLVTGRIDLACEVDGGLEVIDFKVRTRTGLDVMQPETQIQTYGLAVERSGDPVRRVMLHLIAEEPGNDLVAYDWGPEAAAEAATMLDTAAKGIRDERFDAKPGEHCRFCDFRDLCPESAAPRRSRTELEVEDAISLGAAP